MSSLSPEWPMMMRSGGTPRSVRKDCCSVPFRAAGRECVVMATPVSCWATAAADMTRATSGVIPSRSVMTFSIPARTRVPPIPSVMSRTNSSVSRSGPSMARPGPWNWK